MHLHDTPCYEIIIGTDNAKNKPDNGGTWFDLNQEMPQCTLALQPP